MAIKLQDGGFYVDASGVTVGPMIDRGTFAWQFIVKLGDGQAWQEDGAGSRPGARIVRVASEPSVTFTDPIAHLFEDVPAVRKFVGGKVYCGVSIRIRPEFGDITITSDAGATVYASTKEARRLIAALTAAIEAIEAATPEEK
jgi:hypothetical protein